MFVTQSPVPTYSFDHASGNFTDTETIIRYNGGRVSVNVRLLPGFMYWTAPSAATIRKWVDEVLAIESSNTRVRDGQRVQETNTFSGWNYTYYTKLATN